MLFWIILIILAVALAMFLYWQDNSLVTTEYEMESAVLPEALDGCRLIHLSDLHNKGFGTEQKRLIRELERARPDLILITGDLIDKRRSSEKRCANAISLLRQAAELAPVFFVAGNHEWQSGFYDSLRPQMETLGVTILENQVETLEHGGAGICLIGLTDRASIPGEPVGHWWNLPGKVRSPIVQEHNEIVKGNLEKLCEGKGGAFQILMSHRPELADIYAEAGVDLAFCGHAHGGQIRLPGIGGLLAPDQGWHPEYCSDAHVVGETVMVVSRGLGNSLFPFRVFNRPEVVAMTLRSENAGEDAPEEETVLEAVREEASEQQSDPEIPEEDAPDSGMQLETSESQTDQVQTADSVEPIRKESGADEDEPDEDNDEDV